jgi:hypothetical protein
MELKIIILEVLQKNRPRLLINSLKTYVSCLVALYNKLQGNDGLEFLIKM